MSLQNKWVGYLERGYFQIKQSILNRVRQRHPEITDFSESNIFVIIVSIFAGLIEQLNYYIDQLMRESFLPTARRFSSVVRLVNLIDYRIKAANPASTDLKITLLNAQDEPYDLQYGQEETIPQDTLIVINGMDFYTTRDITINYPYNYSSVPVAQFSNYTQDITLSSVSANMTFPLGTDYVHNSLSVLINSVAWEIVDTFARSGPDDKHVIADIGLDGQAYIKFGDGTKGALPNVDDPATFSWKRTKGPTGNIPAHSIDTKTTPSFTLDYASKIHIESPNDFTGGTLYETIEDVRKNAPLSLRTLNRAVTYQDYIDIAKMHPGVDKANIHFDCGKYVTVYISPKNGGLASQALLDNINNWFDQYRMLTTFVDMKATGEAIIHLKLTVVGRLHMKTADIEAEVKDALLNHYNYDNSDVGKAVRLSDIYALVDNQPTVDYVNMDNLYAIPYFFPENHNVSLNKTFTLIGTNKAHNYRLSFISGTTWFLYKDGFYEAQLTTGSEYDNGKFKLTPEDGAYSADSHWRFTIYPANRDIIITDFSIPIIKEENLTLVIKEIFN